MMRHLAVVAALTALLAGCQSTDDGGTVDKQAANALSTGLADAIGRCWFGPNETAFSGYIYTPENVGGLGRILIVPKDQPTGRPALVVQPRSGTAVDVYGPLAASALGPRINADISRWRSGGTGCGS